MLALFLLAPVWPMMAATFISIMDIDEVRAAENRRAKKATENIWP